jgi:hypothetical protein
LQLQFVQTDHFLLLHFFRKFASPGALALLARQSKINSGTVSSLAPAGKSFGTIFPLLYFRSLCQSYKNFFTVIVGAP